MGSPTLALVFFSQRQDGASRRMESLVAWVKVTQKKNLRVLEIDADRNPKLTRRLRVTTIPSLVLLQDGAVVARLEGRATGRQIEALIRPYVAALRWNNGRPTRVRQSGEQGDSSARASRAPGRWGLRPRRRQDMTLTIGDTAPDFTAETTEGPISFHDWVGDSWAVLFSHPKDFTPVCTTELGYMARIKPEFDRRGVKIMGISVDSTNDHEGWVKDIEETQGAAPNYPIIGDADFAVSKLYGMLPAEVEGDAKARTPADNQTVRNVFVVGPDKKVKLVLVYPMTTGRNFDEVLRVIDSLQLTAKHRVATPVNWQQGDDVIIAGSVSNDEAKEIWPDGWEEPKPYIRIVPQPEAEVLAESKS